MTVKDDVVLGGMALGALALAAWYLSQHGAEMAQGLVKAAPEAVANTVAAGAIGIGDAIGIPETNQTECEKAIAEGRTWDASFACPAGTWIKSLWN